VPRPWAWCRSSTASNVGRRGQRDAGRHDPGDGRQRVPVDVVPGRSACRVVLSRRMLGSVPRPWASCRSSTAGNVTRSGQRDAGRHDPGDGRQRMAVEVLPGRSACRLVLSRGMLGSAPPRPGPDPRRRPGDVLP
jgi:hypothetical protein